MSRLLAVDSKLSIDVSRIGMACVNTVKSNVVKEMMELRIMDSIIACDFTCQA